MKINLHPLFKRLYRELKERCDLDFKRLRIFDHKKHPIKVGFSCPTFMGKFKSRQFLLFQLPTSVGAYQFNYHRKLLFFYCTATNIIKLLLKNQKILNGNNENYENSK